MAIFVKLTYHTLPGEELNGDYLEKFVFAREDAEAEGALRAAIQTFLETKEGVALIRRNHETFDWDDALKHIPTSHFKKHGFTTLRAGDSFRCNGNRTITVSVEENLIPETYYDMRFLDDNGELDPEKLKSHIIRSMVTNMNELLEGSEDLLSHECPSGDLIVLQLHAEMTEQPNGAFVWQPLYRVYRLAYDEENDVHTPDSTNDDTHIGLDNAILVFKEMIFYHS